MIFLKSKSGFFSIYLLSLTLFELSVGYATLSQFLFSGLQCFAYVVSQVLQGSASALCKT